MSDVVLVMLGRPDAAPALLDAARRLAELVDCARINVLAVRESNAVRPFSAEVLIDPADAYLIDQARERDRVTALKTVFDHWIAAAGPLAAITQWTEAEGSAATIVGERGSRADLIVAGAPDKDDPISRQTFRAALFGTDRPILMMPRNAPATFGRRVAIAWRDDKQAARAVIPALRCLKSAERVHVITGTRNRVERPPIPRILVEHGIQAELHALPIGPAPFAQALLDEAHKLGADLLVMGAYAHSPLRELLLGGVTRYMLAHADLPILLRH